MQKADQRLGELPLGAVVSKRALNPKDLAASCRVKEERVIKRWHVYLCDVVNAPQP